MILWLLAAVAAAGTATVHTVTTPPVVDGHLDELAWQEAQPVTDFVRYQPTEGGAPGGSTEVRFLQDAQTLYIGVRVRDTPMPVRARLSAREAINADDQVGIYLDPFGDAQAGYIFYFNALGIQQDIQFTAGSWNVDWNAVYKSRGTVTPDGRGYDLEVALPFASIRYARRGGSQEWGVIVTRKIPGEGAKYSFPKLVRGHPRLFTQAARLQGVRPPPQGSGIELIPGLTVRMEGTRAELEEPLSWTDGDPWHELVRPSIDVRAGITPNLTLVGAINPDFSQVESDVTPVVLNARFAFSFQERRPFFTEGAGFLEDTQDTLYSRSVVEPLYGLKLAGREGPWSVGVLHAVDRSPTPSFHERGTPGFDEVEDRWAVDTMLRVRRDLPGAGWFGLTLADKRLVGENLRAPADRPQQGAGADNLGFDAAIPLAARWMLVARHDQSLVVAGGDLLGGSATGLTVRRPSGKGLGTSLYAGFSSKGYRQELGFRNQSGLFDASARIDWVVPGRGLLSTWTPALQATALEEVFGEHYRQLRMDQSLLFAGVHNVRLSARIDQRREGLRDPSDLVGGGIELAWSGQVGAALEFAATGSYGRVMDFRDRTGARQAVARLDATLRPLTLLRLDLIGRYTWFQREQQVSDLPDASDDILLRGRALLQLHRAWGVRVIGEYSRLSTRAPQLSSSVLVTWLIHPYTAIYLGYGERAIMGPGPDGRRPFEPGALERTVFLKAHVLLRPDRLARRGGRAERLHPDLEIPPLYGARDPSPIGSQFPFSTDRAIR